MPTPTSRANLRNALRYRLGNRDDLTISKQDEWLDRGLRELSTRVFIRDLESIDTTRSLTNGSNTVLFPINMVAVTDIRNTVTDLPIEFIEKSRWRQLKITAGTPRQWTVVGTTIFLDKFATSNDNLSIMGVLAHTWSLADGGTPPCDPQYEYGLLLMAALVAFRDLGDSARAALIENPAQPGTGEFHVWKLASKLPPLIQGMANRRQSGVTMDMTGYQMM